MSWSKVGDWIKDNAGAGVGLVGSLLTGNVPGAIAAGVSMVSSATGSDDPAKALQLLQGNPETVLKLKELYFKNEEAVRSHLEEMTRLDLEDKQEEHKTTQATIQAGDRAEDVFVRRTRPAQSWCSLLGAFIYVFTASTVDVAVLTIFMALPFAYAGLRQIGKNVDAKCAMQAIVGAGGKS